MKYHPFSTVVRYFSVGSLMIVLVSCQARHEEPLTAGPIICSGASYQLPTAEHAWQHNTINDGSILVTIIPDATLSPNGKLFLGRDPVAQADLGSSLKIALATRPKAPVFLRVDQLVEYGIVAAISDIAFEAGAERLFFLVEQAAAKWPNVYGFDCAKPVEISQPTDTPELKLKRGKDQSVEVAISDIPFSAGELPGIWAELISAAPPSGRPFFVKPANDVSYQDLVALLDTVCSAGKGYFTLWTPKCAHAFPRPIS